jgi:heptosyltransferase-2
LFGRPFFSSKKEEPEYNVPLVQIRSVLLVRLDEIGDVVLTTPLLRELRRNMPCAWITLIVKPAAYNFVELCPHVNEVLTFNWQGHGLLEPFQRHWRALTVARRFLRKRHFELAILPRWDIDWYHGTFLAYFSGAMRRIGYSEKVATAKQKFNHGFDSLLTEVFPNNTLINEVQHNLDVVRVLGGEVREDHLDLWLSADDERFADNFLQLHETRSDDLLIALGPGAGSPKRRWPLESYSQIGNWLQNNCQTKIIIIGGPEDGYIGRELQSRLGPTAIDATGKATLRQSAALLKRCALYIGNDAGPMHIAAAARTPVVELSCHPKAGSDGSANSPRRFGPWGTKSVIVQPDDLRAPCVDECGATAPHCILGISVDHVKDVLTELMSCEEVVSRYQHHETIYVF